jgi:cold shock CspA family protein
VDAVAVFTAQDTEMESRRISSAGPSAGEREAGIIVNWGLGNHYGFIQRAKDPRGRNVFLHASALPPDTRYPLATGTLVSFSVVQSAKGPRAAEVRLERGRA